MPASHNVSLRMHSISHLRSVSAQLFLSMRVKSRGRGELTYIVVVIAFIGFNDFAKFFSLVIYTTCTIHVEQNRRSDYIPYIMALFHRFSLFLAEQLLKYSQNGNTSYTKDIHLYQLLLWLAHLATARTLLLFLFFFSLCFLY